MLRNRRIPLGLEAERRRHIALTKMVQDFALGFIAVSTIILLGYHAIQIMTPVDDAADASSYEGARP